jgi:hypothetical protein
MLDKLAEPARRAQSRVLAAFNPEEREDFIALLEKFVGRFNETTRVPIETNGAGAKREHAA